MNTALKNEDIQLITAFRHDLHQHPELSGKEYRTCGKIREFLSALPGCRILDLPVETGVVAQIRGTEELNCVPGCDAGQHRRVTKFASGNSKSACKTEFWEEVMLRADIDALPQTECVDIPWKSSVPGVMHACGHDLHTAALCGAALLLCRMKQEGAVLPTIDLVFQPAEEGTTGARMLIDAGLFSVIHPSICFGMHNWPSVETGRVVCREGAIMSAKRNFDIVVHGRGGHGSMPHLNVDPIVCAAAMIQSLQTVVSRNVNPIDAGILSINMIEGGSPVNLVVDQVRMKATVRSLSETVLDRMIERVEAIVESISQAYECRTEIIWKERIPAVWNSPEMTKDAIRCAEESGLILADAAPSLSSEDFALYREYVPSFFFWLGSRAVGNEIHELHTPQFFADDRAIVHGARLYAACADGRIQGSGLNQIERLHPLPPGR